MRSKERGNLSVSPSLCKEVSLHRIHASSREQTFHTRVWVGPKGPYPNGKLFAISQRTPDKSACSIKLYLTPSATDKYLWRSYIGKTVPLRGMR